MASAGLASVSDVRVPPLVQSRWSQGDAGNGYCYNYYTPYKYDSGCVATAMAQVMRYFQYPTAGPGTPKFGITVDGVPSTRRLRGGDGSGGAYNWANMVLAPGDSITTAQRQAIGALCFDAGVSVSTDYAFDGSAAYLTETAQALVATFGYSNAISVDANGSLGTLLLKILNPNLDAGRPVMLAIDYSKSWDNGHALVCDGYGYNASTLYHHLNFGWAGLDDTWYNLPNITTSDSVYDVVDAATFNVYVTGSDEIISGRVTDSKGAPVGGATVQATASGGAAYTATTNSRGIYAIEHAPSSTSYTVTCTKAGGYNFGTGKAVTGRSHTGTLGAGGNCGNVWGVDLQGGTAPPAPTSVSASDGAYPHEIHVTWAAAAGAATYEVWSNTTNDLGAATRIAPSVAGTSYVDTPVPALTTTWYWVRATNAWGAGPFSTPDSGYASGVPVLQVLSAADLDFGPVLVGESETIADAFSIKDTGDGKLKATVSVAAPFHVLDANSLPVASLSFSLNPGEQKSLSFAFAPLAAGPVSRTISFSSNGGSTTRTAKGVGTILQWALKIQAPQGSGTTTPRTGTPLYRVGTTASVKATPASNWAFDHWEGTGVPAGHATDNPIGVPSGTADQTLTLQAVFVQQWTLQVQSPRGSGTTTPGTRKYKYTVGTPSVPVQATPALGWVFDHWAGTAVSPSTHLWDNPIIVPSGTASQRLTLQAVFVQQWTLAVQAPQGNGGTNPDTGSYVCNVGTSVAPVQATPASRWVFDHWAGTAVPSGHAKNNPLTVPSGKANRTRTLQAAFVQQWTLQVQAPQGSGKTTPGTGSPQYTVGTPSAPVKASPASGWVFDHWQGTGVPAGHATDNPITVPSGTADQTLTLQAVFVQKWTLAIQAPQGSGTTTPGTGSVKYMVGIPSDPVRATPAAGWTFDHWVGTGVSPSTHATDNPITVPSGSANRTLTLRAVFLRP
jgi:hypothetical protein